MRGADGGGFGIQQTLTARSETQFDQRTGIGNDLRLPAVVALEFRKGSLGTFIPGARRFTIQVVLTNQGRLNFTGTIRINRLLPAWLLGQFSVLRGLAGDLGGSGFRLCCRGMLCLAGGGL